jgi:hypothetical protein
MALEANRPSTPPEMATTEQRLLGSLNIPPNPAFSGPVVTFDDSSSWKLTKPLSKLAYQQVNSPFEARQVFLCELLEDKEGVYEGISEAVIKSKYQYVNIGKSRHYTHSMPADTQNQGPRHQGEYRQLPSNGRGVHR